MKSPLEIDQQHIDLIIAMAWANQVTFEEIAEKTNLSEPDVIRLMRRELKPSSFRLWRKRIADRLSKRCRLPLLQSDPESRQKTG